MSRASLKFAAAALALLLAACTRSAPPTVQAASIAPASRVKREIRITGLIQAVHSVKIFVPQIQGQYSTMTLTQLVDNGAHVNEGDLIATFDPAQQLDAARDAKAKFEDLQHQIAQKAAENRAAAASRAVDLQSAQADLVKATLELTKGDTVADILKVQNEIKDAAAKIHVDSLTKSNALNDKAEAAAVHVLELQRDRQQIYIQRAQDNIKKLEIHAPQDGMVVYELTYRAGSMGHALLLLGEEGGGDGDGEILNAVVRGTVVISVSGGLLGIGFGYFLAWLIANTAQWKTIVTPSSVLIAFGVSVLVGVVFGIYPALKAARINPIDALRYE